VSTVRICHALNEAGARYILIGGFAVIAHGGARTTKDIDLLVDASPENVARVKRALRILEDHAVDEVADTDVARYTVVRVADEVVVDLMALACGIDYNDAARDVTSLTIDGVAIPIASPATLIRTKNTVRPSDAADRRYLEELLRTVRGEP
jgi:predicted nucleotidyltransferase